MAKVLAEKESVEEDRLRKGVQIPLANPALKRHRWPWDIAARLPKDQHPSKFRRRVSTIYQCWRAMKNVSDWCCSKGASKARRSESILFFPRDGFEREIGKDQASLVIPSMGATAIKIPEPCTAYSVGRKREVTKCLHGSQDDERGGMRKDEVKQPSSSSHQLSQSRFWNIYVNFRSWRTSARGRTTGTAGSHRQNSSNSALTLSWLRTQYILICRAERGYTNE